MQLRKNLAAVAATPSASLLDKERVLSSGRVGQHLHHSVLSTLSPENTSGSQSL